MRYFCATLLQPAVFSEAIQSTYECRSSSGSIAGSTNSCRWNDETCVRNVDFSPILFHWKVGICHLIMLLPLNLQICRSKWSNQNLLTAASNGVPVKEANIPIPTSWKCNVKLVEKLSHTVDLFLCYYLQEVRGLMMQRMKTCTVEKRVESVVTSGQLSTEVSTLTLPICYFACWCMA